VTAKNSPLIPVSVITGFLGSGKTTLLNGLLGHSKMADTAVIVNEFGEIGFDHLLIEQAIEDTVLLENGCICCSIRGDLVDTLLSLHRQMTRGGIPVFSRAAIETTGLADPAPVLQTLMSDPRITGLFELNRIVTTVDAVNGPGQLDEFSEAVKQAAIADEIFLTKVDLATTGSVDQLRSRLNSLNPNAAVTPISQGQVDPDRIFGTGPSRAIAANGLGQTKVPDQHDHTGSHRHDGVSSFTIVREKPLGWDAVTNWLESVISLRGVDILRVKGIVNVEGRKGPIVVHGVQHVFHPPVELPNWPSEDRRTQLVFITRNIDRNSMENTLDAFLERREIGG
jgi:G3E family GTPase